MRSRSPDFACKLLVRRLEVIEQLLIGRGFLQRIQLLPVEVLHQRVPQHLIVGRLPDDRGNQRQPRHLTRAPTPLAHHELIPVGADLPHDYRLKQPDRLDRSRQFGESFLVDDLPWLTRVRGNRRERDLVEVRARNVGDAGRVGGSRAIIWPVPRVKHTRRSRRDQGTKAFAQTPLLLRHLPLPAARPNTGCGPRPYDADRQRSASRAPPAHGLTWLLSCQAIRDDGSDRPTPVDKRCDVQARRHAAGRVSYPWVAFWSQTLTATP